LDAVFSTNLLHDAKITASAVRGNASAFEAAHVLDNDFDTYWTTDDSITTAALEFEFPRKQTFNLLLLQEYIPLGQRVANFNVEYWDDATASWKLLVTATTIGYKRILRVPSTTAGKLRINILQSLACPVLSTIEVY
jgi:alpha-L-fucosidase